MVTITWIWFPHFPMHSKFKFDKISFIHEPFCMKVVVGVKLGTLKLKHTITIICQTGFRQSNYKIMRSHDVIILFILPEWTKMSFFNAANSCFMDKWWALHYVLKNFPCKTCSDDLNYAGYSSCLRKHILWLVKIKLLTLNISWFTPYSLLRIFVIVSDFLYFLNSWNSKLLYLTAWKLSNNIKLNTQIKFFIHHY